MIDSQSVKTTESRGIARYDEVNNFKGRKRHIVIDTLGLMVGLVVHSAYIQDRDGAVAGSQNRPETLAGVWAHLDTED